MDLHPVLRDLGVTAAASVTNFFAGLLVISIFGHLLGVALLSEYLLLRRVAAWLQPSINFGFGVALPRYIAYSIKRSPGSELEYFAAALGCVAILSSGLGIILYATRNPLAAIFFGDEHDSRLIRPLFLLMLGTSVQMGVYGYYRGCLAMGRAAALQICAAMIPILSAAFMFQTSSVGIIVSFIGCSLLGLSVAFAFPIFLRMRRNRLRNIFERAVELLRFGAPRVPGEFSNGALLTVGPVIAAHFMPITRVSYLLVASSMLFAASVSTEPLGLVFLPKISMMLASSRIHEVRMYVTHLISASIDCSIFLTTQLVVFADVIVRALVGPALLEGISVIRLVLIGVPFYLFFAALRSVIDAGSVKALNARNLLFAITALIVTIGVSVILLPREYLLHSIALCLALSLALLACATKRSLAKLYSVKVDWGQSLVPIASAAVLAAIGAAYHRSSHISLLQLAVLEFIFGVVFLAVSFYSGSRWLQLLRRLLSSQNFRTVTPGL